MRAFSTLILKTAPGSARKFSGIASTPSLDMQGDILEPRGASFTLPIPFLWQHDRKDPIGWINEAVVRDDGIHVKGEVATLAGDGPLAKRLGLAWDYITAGLVKGLSVGLLAKERAGNRITKWGWFELSAVTMASNADCTLTAIKSADEALRRSAPRRQGVVYCDGRPSTQRSGVVFLRGSRPE